MAIWTLEKIADAVMNNITDGLQGSPNTPIPKEQLRAEVILTRNAIIEANFMAQGRACKKSPDYAFLEQQINCIDVYDDGDTADCCDQPEGITLPAASIPQVLIVNRKPMISFIGIPERSDFTWKVYYGEGHKTKKYAPATSKRPYIVLYPPKNGYQTIYVHNAPAGLTKLSVTGIFTDPYAKFEYSCCSIGEGDPHDVAELAASETIVEQIVDKLSQKYIGYYRQMNAPIQPNDQTDKTT